MKNGLTFTTENEFNISVFHYTIDALDKATHRDEIHKINSTNIRIDYKNSGLDSNSCGPELDEKYCLAEKNIHFILYIRDSF